MTPALKMYALSATVVALHMLLLAFWTGTMRVRHKIYVNPEDAKVSKGTQADQDHEDVLRVKRTHQNALENAVPFFAVGLLYAMSEPTKDGAIIYFSVFALARILHSIFYLWGRQPFRTLMFAIGALAVVGMGVHVLRHVA
jgi:glutathione S-transferase